MVGVVTVVVLLVEVLVVAALWRFGRRVRRWAGQFADGGEIQVDEMWADLKSRLQ